MTRGQPGSAVQAREEAPRTRLRPRKSLGQHFLTDRRVLQRILAAVSPSPAHTIIEVGAGSGALTQGLAASGARVIAVEIDGALHSRLRERLTSQANVIPVCADVLALSPEELLSQAQATSPYLVVGNLPYNIAAAVVRHFLEATVPPERMVVMVQAEVAQSMAAEPGQMSLLSVGVQFYARPRILFYVPPRAFRPPPKVRSAVLSLDVRRQPAVTVDDREAFFHLVRAGFAAPRKQLRNALALGLGVEAGSAADLLVAAGLDSRRRAQTLSLADWGSLYRAWRDGQLCAENG